jgi:site-specific DNA-adenine methylase
MSNLKDIKLIKDIESLERLQSLERLESLESLQSLELNNLDYRDVKLPEPDSCIIYLDPPYRNTC